VKQSLTDDASLDEDVIGVGLALDGVAVVERTRVTMSSSSTMPQDLCRLITPDRAGVPRGAISSSRKPNVICPSSATPINQCIAIATRS